VIPRRRPPSRIVAQAYGIIDASTNADVTTFAGLTEWWIPAKRFDEFNSYIDHDKNEWWDSALGSFFPPS
jgi:hypothetical protein